MLQLLFPPKCTLCRKLLGKNETDLCHHCRTHVPNCNRTKRKIPFIAHWTAMWYYEDDVRKSIRRFKFGNARSYANVYAHLLALRLQDAFPNDFDILAWVPVSRQRKQKRGYDQTELIAKALAKELDMPATPVLKKIRHTPPQSGIRDAAQRRANVLGAYAVRPRHTLTGKRVLLLDDVLTTGATAAECARVLVTAGVKEVYFAAVAVASHDKK